MTPRTTAIIVTLGGSSWLAECLQALRESGGGEIEILLVAQDVSGLRATKEAARLADRTFYLVNNIGFAAANNHAMKEARGEFVATVNDDAVVTASWYGHLVTALESSNDAAAVQGVNLLARAANGGSELVESPLIDSCGMAWNNTWQAVQIGHGEEAPSEALSAREVFGVTSTAALYRRDALSAVADRNLDRNGLPVFDTRLFMWYEDVDLSCRLRAAGYSCLVEPAARALHVGSLSGQRLTLGRWPYIYGNRHLVLARLLGRRYGALLPRILLRDALDFGRALRPGGMIRALGILLGGLRAVIGLRHYLHTGEPRVSPELLIRGLDWPRKSRHTEGE